MKTLGHPSAGFTLIELMVTVAVVSILAMVAVPSFVAYQRNSELTSAANSLLAAVNTARSEAMKRNLKVLVVPYSGTSWGTGWKVFADTNKDGLYSASDEIVVQRDATLPSYFAAPVGTGTAAASTANGPYIMFDGSGFPKSRDATVPNLSITFRRTDDTSPRQTRFLGIARTGRARICTPASASDSTCNATTY